MTEHTPEPWLREGRTIYALNERGTNRMFVHVHCAIPAAHTGDDAEQEANACLIHTAAKLLAALKELEEWFRWNAAAATHKNDINLQEGSPCDPEEVIRAVLAKATGEEVPA